MPNNQRPESATCCGTCPFLKKNADRPNLNGYVCDPQKGQIDWFSQANLDRLWKDGLRHGDPMICHSTDPKAHEYGGPVVASGNERLCTGSILVQFAHVKAYEAELAQTPKANPATVFKRYQKRAGKMAMTRAGLFEFAISVGIGRTGLIGGLPFPISVSEDRPLRLPSGDELAKDFLSNATQS